MAENPDQESCWGAPVARLLHPSRVQIVESIRRAGQPLSAADLVDRLGGRPSIFRTECHLRRLRRLGVVVPYGSAGPGRHAPCRRYRLNEEPGA